jgi:hypothetical protein
MYSLSRKVEYATDIALGRIARLKSYRVQSKKGAKSVWVFIHSILTRFYSSVYLKSFWVIQVRFLKRFLFDTVRI